MKKDKRINVSSMNWKYNLFIFLVILWCCGSYMAIYVSYDVTYGSKQDMTLYMILSLATYMFVLSLLLSCLLVAMRKIFLMKPLQYIGAGARKLAEGDLTVRLKPLRKDGKKMK